MTRLFNIKIGWLIVVLVICHLVPHEVYSQRKIDSYLDSIAIILKQEQVAIDSTTVGPQPYKNSKGNNKEVEAKPKGLDQKSINETDSAKTKKNPEKEGVIENLANGTEDKLDDITRLISGNNIFYSVVFLLFGYFFIKILSYIFNALAERSPSYRIAFKGAIPIIKIVTWSVIIAIIIISVFRPSITTMLAFSASIGVAVGFASQDILKNVFGGVVILLDRPFVSGDKIEVDKYYGEVIEIGLRSTRIVTPDDSVVTVPNAVMMNSSVSNANSGELNCQVVAEIFLPNTIDTGKVRALATEAVSVSKYVYLNKPIVILFLHEQNYNNSFIKMKIKAYVMDTRDEFKFKSEVTEIVVKEMVKEGILH